MIVYQLVIDGIGLLTDEDGDEFFFDNLEQVQEYVIDNKIDYEGLRIVALDVDKGEYLDD